MQLLSDQWHAFFENAPPYAGQVSEIIVQSGPYAYVHARTVNGTGDLGNWQVTQGASDGVVTVNVTDNGSNSVSFVVHGTDDYQDIAMNFDCSKVQRF